jgi:hypothetical protein
MEEFLKYFIKPTQAIETRCQCNFGHRHLRFMDKMLSKKYTSGLCDGDWWGSEVLDEEPAQLAFTDAKALSKCIHAVSIAIEGSVGDECKCSRYCVGCPSPRG